MLPKKKLRSSWTVYKEWGKGKKIQLRFSKSGHPKIERLMPLITMVQKRVSKIRKLGV